MTVQQEAHVTASLHPRRRRSLHTMHVVCSAKRGRLAHRRWRKGRGRASRKSSRGRVLRRGRFVFVCSFFVFVSCVYLFWYLLVVHSHIVEFPGHLGWKSSHYLAAQTLSFLLPLLPLSSFVPRQTFPPGNDITVRRRLWLARTEVRLPARPG